MNTREESDYWREMSHEMWSKAQDMLELSDKYWEISMRLLNKQ